MELLSTTCHRFMDSGWPVLNVWLAEAKKNQDVAILVEVLQVCVCVCTHLFMFIKYFVVWGLLAAILRIFTLTHRKISATR